MFEIAKGDKVMKKSIFLTIIILILLSFVACQKEDTSIKSQQDNSPIPTIVNNTTDNKEKKQYQLQLHLIILY